MRRRNQNKLNAGCRLWHLALTIIAMGLTMRLALGSLPMPEPESDSQYNPYTAHQTDPAPTTTRHWQYKHRQRYQPRSHHRPFGQAPAIDALPFDLNGKVPGPLLTGILQRHVPHSTPVHADQLRNTLPPGENPRMIVILPEDEQDSEVY